MPDVKRTVLLVTTQQISQPAEDNESLPIRDWSIEVHLLNEHGEPVPSKLFSKVTYLLHPSFGNRKRQVFRAPPFRIEESGWGEFDMQIVFTVLDKDYTIDKDLHFQKEKYESKHVLTFKNPDAALLNLLRESGPVPDNNSSKKRTANNDASARKKKRAAPSIDLGKLADGLQQLHEDDLLHVVQTIVERKTTDSYTKNDSERGEFHVDLYTLPDNLIKTLWDFAEEKRVV